MITFEEFKNIGKKYGYSISEQDNLGAKMQSSDTEFIRGTIAQFKCSSATNNIIDESCIGYAVCNTEPKLLEFLNQKPYVWVQSCSGFKVAEDVSALEDCFGDINNKLKGFIKIKRKEEIDRL